MPANKSKIAAMAKTEKSANLNRRLRKDRIADTTWRPITTNTTAGIDTAKIKLTIW